VFIGLGLEKARFLQGSNIVMVMMMMMILMTTRKTTMKTSCLHSHMPTDFRTTTPFVGWLSTVPSQWQESPKHDTKHPHDHKATVLQTFASLKLPLATLPAKSYVSERVTRQNSQP
jgi:hypothetical protein